MEEDVFFFSIGGYNISTEEEVIIYIHVMAVKFLRKWVINNWTKQISNGHAAELIE